MYDRESDSEDLHCCPYLGLGSAPSLHCPHPTPSHRCFRWPTPQPVDDRQQESFCLAGYSDCGWFVPVLELAQPRQVSGPLPFGGRGLLGLVALALAIAVALILFRPWSWMAPASLEGDRVPAAAETATPAGAGVVPAPSASATPEATPSPTESPAPSPTPTGTTASAGRPTSAPATATRGPATATATRAPARATATRVPPTQTAVRPAATAGPTPVPGATAPPVVRLYTVKEGETLSSIAASLGVTVEDLRRANGLAEGASVRAGQPLVVPAR